MRFCFSLAPIVVPPVSSSFWYTILGKVHERDRNSEFLLIVLRGLLAKRPDLRLVLMSATLQQGKYSGYFGGCPITTIGARTFPVQVRSRAASGIDGGSSLIVSLRLCSLACGMPRLQFVPNGFFFPYLVDDSTLGLLCW